MRASRAAVVALLLLLGRAAAEPAELEPGEEEEVVVDNTKAPRDKRPPSRPPGAATVAQPAGRAMGGSATGEPPTARRQTTIFVDTFSRGDVAPADLLRVHRATKDALVGEGQTVTDLDALQEKSRSAAQDLLDADRKINDASTAIQELDLGNADAAARAAIATYERRITHLLARDGSVAKLGAAHRLVAIARFLDGDDNGARQHVVACLVLDPTFEFDGTQLPGEMAPLVEESRRRYEGSAIGTLEVEEHDLPAHVLIDGREAGTAPLVAPGLKAAPHLVTVAVPGHPPTTTTVTIAAGKKPTRLHVEFEDYDGETLPALRRAEGEVGEPVVGDGMRAASGTLDAPDKMVFVRLGSTAEGLHLETFLYDMRAGRMGARTEAVAHDGEGAEVAGRLASGILVPVATPPRPEEHGRPLAPIARVTGHSALWPVVGIIAGIVAVGAVVGIAASSGLSRGDRLVLVGIPF